MVRFYLCDPTFSRFSRTPTCDRQTDRHRQTQKQTDTGPWLVPLMHSIARYKLQNYKIVELIPFQLLKIIITLKLVVDGLST